MHAREDLRLGKSAGSLPVALETVLAEPKASQGHAPPVTAD